MTPPGWTGKSVQSSHPPRPQGGNCNVSNVVSVEPSHFPENELHSMARGVFHKSGEFAFRRMTPPVWTGKNVQSSHPPRPQGGNCNVSNVVSVEPSHFPENELHSMAMNELHLRETSLQGGHIPIKTPRLNRSPLRAGISQRGPGMAPMGQERMALYSGRPSRYDP